MKNLNKYVRYFAIIYIGIPLIYILFFNNPDKDEIDYLLSNHIDWIIETKYIDTQYKNKKTIDFYDVSIKKKDKFRLNFFMYSELYNYLQVGDTLIKTKGELLFQVKRGKESKSFLIIPPEK